MSGATEIYLCRKGQGLKEGRIEYSDSISSKADAEADAVERCRLNKVYAKVAYYTVNEDGDFRCIFTYMNPNYVATDDEEKPKEEKKKKKKPVKKPSLLSRLVDPLMGSNKKKKPIKKKKSKTA